MCEMGGGGWWCTFFTPTPSPSVTKFCLLRKSVRNKDGSNIVSLFNPLTPMGELDNFSLQYQYNVNQISDKNKEK